ncbi:MAG: hypothetical protein QME05_04040 [Candidatus Margulisbacteria bacterium]|nr:hypothetical protein [Candidatus Margulisiibacteriota bacterium]
MKNKAMGVMVLLCSLFTLHCLLSSGCSTTSTVTTTTTASTTSTSSTVSTTSTTTSSVTTSTVDATAQDMQSIAAGLQSSGSGASNGGNSNSDAINTAKSQSVSYADSIAYDVSAQYSSPEGEGWNGGTYSYTWTASGGAVVTEEGWYYQRMLNASGGVCPPAQMLTWEVHIYPTLTYEVTLQFLARYIQGVQYSSNNYYEHYMNMTTQLPSISFSMDDLAHLSMSMSATGEGEITFLSTTPTTTFEITNMNMVMTMEGSTVSGTASFDWSYTGPSGNTYHGSLSMAVDADGGTPTTMTGNVLDADNNVVGTITIDNVSGTVRIRLNDGTDIYAGV